MDFTPNREKARSVLAPWICLYAALLPRSAFNECSSATCDEPPNVQRDMPREAKSTYSARLQARLQGTDDNPQLLITLRNSGREPITVDRELVFLVDVCPTDSEGRPVARMVKELEPPQVDGAALKKRFVTLPPGQSVSRKIDLRKGYKDFRFGVATGAKGLHLPTRPYEAAYSVAPEREIGRVYVWYGVFRQGFRPAFKAYTGIETSEIGLFESAANTVILKLRTEADDKK